MAEAIEQVHGDRVEPQAADLAHHLYQAGAAADSEKTVRFLTLAGDQAVASGAFDEAVRLFEDALSIEDAAGPRRRAALETRRGMTLRALDRDDEAIEALRSALDDLDQLRDTAGLADVAEALAWTLGWNGRLEEALAVVARVLPMLPEADTSARCRMMMPSGAFFSAKADARGLTVLAEARALAEASNDPTLVGLVEGRTGPLRFQWMLVGDTLDAASDALSAVSASSEPWDRADLLWATGYLSWMGGRPGDAAELLAELRPLAERLGHRNAAWLATTVPVFIDLTTDGDLEAAEAGFSHALQRAEVTGRPVLVEAGYRLVGTVQFLRGDWRSAEASLRRAVEVGNTPSVRGTATGQLTLVLACSGDTVAAVDALDGAALPSAGQPNALGTWAALSSAVQAGVELGRPEQVRELYPLTKEALDTGAVFGHDFSMWEAVAGMAAAAGEQWDAADRHFNTALRQAEEIPNKIAQPEVRRAWARMLIQRNGPGDRDRARTLLDEATELYGALGMPKHLQMAEKMLN